MGLSKHQSDDVIKAVKKVLIEQLPLISDCFQCMLITGQAKEAVKLYLQLLRIIDPKSKTTADEVLKILKNVGRYRQN